MRGRIEQWQMVGSLSLLARPRSARAGRDANRAIAPARRRRIRARGKRRREAPWVEKVAFLAAGGFIEGKRAARDSKARARRHRYVNTCCMARFSKNPLELHHRELLPACSGTRGGFI